MTGEQLTLLDRSELLELVRPLGPIEDGDTYGAVYTKAWVVDLMLDLSNYRSERDLALVKLLEPAYGDGAFLLRIVQRLSRSLRANDRPLSDARNAIRGGELHLVGGEDRREDAPKRSLSLCTVASVRNVSNTTWRSALI